jgi:hypothetical protein
MAHVLFYKVIFNKTMDCYEGFFFQFCDIANLVSLSKNLTKCNLFAQEKQKKSKIFTIVFSKQQHSLSQKMFTRRNLKINDYIYDAFVIVMNTCN